MLLKNKAVPAAILVPMYWIPDVGTVEWVMPWKE